MADDSVDLGETFTYTGCGGRDLKGTKQNPKNLRTAPQTFDQSFEHSTNASLKVSLSSRNKQREVITSAQTSSVTRKPVRVIRGFKLQSPFAPATGYRYDGLYIIERAWLAPGLTKGLKVCKFAFKRVKGQPPLPRNDEAGEEGEVEAEVEVQESEAEATPEGDEHEEAENEEDEEADAEEEREEQAEPAPTGRRTSSRKSNGAKPTPATSQRSSAPLPKPSNGYRKARASFVVEVDANWRRSRARYSLPQPAINGKRKRASTPSDTPPPPRESGRRTSVRVSSAAAAVDDGEDENEEEAEPARKRIMVRRYRRRTEEAQNAEVPEVKRSRSTNNVKADAGLDDGEAAPPAAKRPRRSTGTASLINGEKEVTPRRSRRSLA